MAVDLSGKAGLLTGLETYTVEAEVRLVVVY
jgi:hypothetical protein